MGMRVRSSVFQRPLRGLRGPMLIPCPKCGDIFDARAHTIETCPICKTAGSTACCNPHGAECIFAECERKKS
jgi:hypothetical protein